MPKSKTTRDFIDEVYKLVGDEYEVTGLYAGAKNPIEIKHNTCGNVYYPIASNFLQGCRCSKCFGKRKKTTEQFILEINKLFDGSISILSNYINSKEYVKCKCNVCGNMWEAFPMNLLKKSGCPNCSIKRKKYKFMKKESTFKKELYNIHLGKIDSLEKYAGNKLKIKFKCNVCGNIWSATPNKVLNARQGCPSCSSSHGEREIERFLKNNNIEYETQKEFDDLIGIYLPLRYDFYLPKNNILIEYQGEYHDGNVRNQTKKELLKRQEYDTKKRNYAKEHNLELIEIWYWDFDRIERILFDLLLKKQPYKVAFRKSNP